MARVIVFPCAEVAICGVPPMVKLSDNQARAMARIHLGGPEALRTETYRASCRTVQSLFDAGLLDKNGPTYLGKRVAESCAESGLV